MSDDIKETWQRDHGRVVVCRTQDVEPYLEANKRERNDFQAQRDAPMRKVAEIPNIVVEQWLKMGVNIYDPNDNKKVQQLLNSNEWSYLRTSPGKMAMK